jgi:hypothetical protein
MKVEMLVVKKVPEMAKTADFCSVPKLDSMPRAKRMTSEVAVRANRLNALQSTGPRTAAGKAIAARNHTTCGLFASTLVIEAAGETAAAWDEFRAAVLADLQPVGVVEHELAADVAGLL